MEWLGPRRGADMLFLHNTKLPLLARCRVGNGRKENNHDDAEYAEISHRKGAPVVPVRYGVKIFFALLLLAVISPPSQRCSACIRVRRTDMYADVNQVLPPLRLIMFVGRAKILRSFPGYRWRCVEDAFRYSLAEGHQKGCLLDRGICVGGRRDGDIRRTAINQPAVATGFHVSADHGGFAAWRRVFTG